MPPCTVIPSWLVVALEVVELKPELLPVVPVVLRELAPPPDASVVVLLGFFASGLRRRFIPHHFEHRRK